MPRSTNIIILHCNTPTTGINDIFININSNQLYAQTYWLVYMP